MKAYKGFTYDLRPPVQGGDPIWDGSLPFILPEVKVDESEDDCGLGWNACRNIKDVFSIAGFCPKNYPIRIFEVSTEKPVIERKKKLRASTWIIERELSKEEIQDGIRDFSKEHFGDLADEMTQEQIAWREALACPERDEAKVEAGLREALIARGLSDWTLKRFESEDELMDAQEARHAWDARHVWCAWDAWVARRAWEAWAARRAWEAWAARDALTVYYASRMGWVKSKPDMLTIGIRDAHRAGLKWVFPTGPKELGWVMK